jgi:Na+/proline symporter
MEIETGKSQEHGKGEIFLRVGYWAMIIVLLIISLSLAYGAPSTIAKNMTIFPLFLVIFFLGYLGLGRHHKDERLAKMATRAMTASWILSLLIVSALTTPTVYYFLNLTALQVLGVVITVMVSSMAAFNEYYKRKGDIDF